MACACNKDGANKSGGSWIVTEPGGKRTSYASEVEAKAAAARKPGASARPAP